MTEETLLVAESWAAGGFRLNLPTYLFTVEIGGVLSIKKFINFKSKYMSRIPGIKKPTPIEKIKVDTPVEETKTQVRKSTAPTGRPPTAKPPKSSGSEITGVTLND